MDAATRERKKVGTSKVLAQASPWGRMHKRPIASFVSHAATPSMSRVLRIQFFETTATHTPVSAHHAVVCLAPSRSFNGFITTARRQASRISEMINLSPLPSRTIFHQTTHSAGERCRELSRRATISLPNVPTHRSLEYSATNRNALDGTQCTGKTPPMLVVFFFDLQRVPHFSAHAKVLRHGVYGV